MTAPAKPAPIPATADANYALFFSEVLHDLGITPTTGDLQALASTAHFEGLNSYFNPLNITYHSGDNPTIKGVSTLNSVGVQEYGSFNQGVAATVAFFGNPGINPVWNNFLAGLKSGSESQTIAGLDSAYQSWGSNGPSALSTNSAENVLASKIGTSSIDVKPPNAGERIATDIGNVGSAVTKPFTSTADFLTSLWGDISSKDWWIRAGFIILGLLMLLIAVDKLTDGGITGGSGKTTDTIDLVESKGESGTTAVSDTVQEHQPPPVDEHKERHGALGAAGAVIPK